MSFDKVKAMRNAERFLSQGKIRAAISEYQRIVENDPRDYSTLNILGDLHVKNGESKEAVGCYKKVAEHYSKQGFAQKAIAIYNKIQRIEPNSADVSEKLAKLYQMKGSFAEARSHYVALAEQFQRKGQKAEALEIWKQIAQLDPTNTEVYLKIADFCSQDGNKEEAAKAYTEAGLRFSSQNKLEQALSAFSNALEIRQYDLTALNGLVNTQVKLGYAEDAAKTLENILEKQPYNREILYMLVDCYLDANNPSEAEKAVIRLVEQEPANYPKFINLVEVYIKNDDLDSAVRILSMSSEHLLVGGKPDEFLRWTNEILAQNPEQVDALRLLVRYYGWQRDETELKKSLERLAETARSQELIDDERYALSQLVMILPHEVNYAKRLQEMNTLYGAVQPEAEHVASFDFPPRDENLPSFEGFTLLNDQPANGQADVFEDYSHYASEIGYTEGQEDFVYDDSAVSVSTGGASGFSITSTGVGVEAMQAQTAVVKLSPAEEYRLSQELESVDFYISQNYTELAEKTLEILESEFGARPEFADYRAKLGVSASLSDEVNAPLPEKNAETEQKFEVAEESKPEAAESAQSFNFLDDFRSELGLEETAPEEEGDYDTHYQLAIAYKEMGLMEESIREFQEAVNMVRADDGTRRFFQCCNLLGLCFMEQGMPNLALLWYRRALETPNLTDEERQAMLYETANAYEMGGETPKAVEYFEQIYAVNVDYRDVSDRLEQLREHNFAM